MGPVSNQRVVVLTDEEIESLLFQYKDGRLFDAENKLRASLEHPEGITDEMVERSLRVVPASLTLGCTCSWDEDGNPPANCGCVARSEEATKLERRRALEAALFPGDVRQEPNG
jgi:hypothetical protein